MRFAAGQKRTSRSQSAASDEGVIIVQFWETLRVKG